MARRTTHLLAALVLTGCPGSDDGSDGGDAGDDGSGSVGSVSGGSMSAGGTGSAGDDGDGNDDGASTSGPGTSADDGSAGSTGGDTSGASQDDTAGSDGSSGGETTGGDGDANVLHVSELGQDSNPGTADAPLRTIQWALAQAAMDPEIDTIRVAGGTYAADVANDASIVLVDGVSLHGGWDEGFDDRDPLTWPSVVVDSSPQAPPNTSENAPARLIEIPEGVTSATVFDGFRVEIGLGLYRAGILVEGDATISGNHFVHGGGASAVLAYAINVQGGDPAVLGNRIELDYEGDASQVYGIAVNTGDPVIANNVVTVTGGTYAHYAVSLTNASPDVIGNSLQIGSGSNPWVIRLFQSSAPLIDDNLLQTDAGTGLCIASISPGAVPAGLHNNLLQCYFTVWGNGDSPFSSWTTIAEVHASVPNASGNVKLAGPLVDPADGLLLDDAAPCTVARGGLDISGDYPNDFAGLPRTDPVSIGAHEWDGACQ